MFPESFMTLLEVVKNGTSRGFGHLLVLNCPCWFVYRAKRGPSVSEKWTDTRMWGMQPGCQVGWITFRGRVLLHAPIWVETGGYASTRQLHFLSVSNCIFLLLTIAFLWKQTKAFGSNVIFSLFIYLNIVITMPLCFEYFTWGWWWAGIPLQ